MNKIQGAKSAYRGFGSIDFRAAARSVLLVGRPGKGENQRMVTHNKSSLALEGPTILSSLDDEKGFTWDGFSELTAGDLLTGGRDETKVRQAEQMLKALLVGEEMPSEELLRHASRLGISERTLKSAKQNLGGSANRREGKWYTLLTPAQSEDSSIGQSQ